MTSIEFIGSACDVSDLTMHENPRIVRCHLAIITDPDGTVSVVVLNLPGTGSSGPDEETAIERVHEAVQAVVETYEQSGEEVPWIDNGYDVPKGAKLLWILVHV